MAILVTGGTGFVGKRLVKKLISKGEKVTIFTRKEDEHFAGKVKFVLGDVRNKNTLAAAFKGIDTVYHLAVCLDEASPEMYEINTLGTKNVVELCKENKIKQLIYLSSSGVLGETRAPATEGMPYNPKTRYEKSKMESENMIKMSGVPFTIVRTSIIIGPNPIWAAIIHAAKKQYPIIGDGKNYFHLAYIEDVVDILTTVKNNKNAANEIFHVATPDTPTYLEVYKIICDEIKSPVTKKHVSVRLIKLLSILHGVSCKVKGKKPKLTLMRSSIDRLIRNRIISTSKATRELGFVPRYSTKMAVKETVKYLQIARLGYNEGELIDIDMSKR